MNVQSFSAAVLEWYRINKRDLPWRKENIDPYQVVVSEIMLQQTQVPRVIEKFREFMDTFPTLKELADASKADVIQSWSGLGYNRRALMLHQFAKEVMIKYDGEIPAVPEALNKLPGIGPYTAGSIASFAFNRPEPAIDVNVRRIYLRFFSGKDQGLPMGAADERRLYDLVKESIPEGKSRDLHNALMDFGSLVCMRDAPVCSECPLQRSCKFAPVYKTKKQEVLFVMEKKKEPGKTENGRHVPNRIFRGRIVEFVRKNEGREVKIHELGENIKKDYIKEEKEWLLGLCTKLQKEGFIKIERDEEMLTLELAKS